MSARVRVTRRLISPRSSDRLARCSASSVPRVFCEAARERCARRGLTNVEFREGDLMELSLGELGYDASWCRWVASFVSSPQKLVENIAGALRPGGIAIFHEYSDYLTFRFMPIRPALEKFEVIVSDELDANAAAIRMSRDCCPNCCATPACA